LEPAVAYLAFCAIAKAGLGYIDLSKRRVSPEDIVRCEERYNKSKIVHSIMRHVAEKTQTPIETLYETIGWPLNKKYGHALDAFKLSITYVSSYVPGWTYR
jgi:translation initiation factor 2 subunit 1